MHLIKKTNNKTHNYAHKTQNQSVANPQIEA